jgi:hypothetical protein
MFDDILKFAGFSLSKEAIHIDDLKEGLEKTINNVLTSRDTSLDNLLLMHKELNSLINDYTTEKYLREDYRGQGYTRNTSKEEMAGNLEKSKAIKGLFKKGENLMNSLVDKIKAEIKKEEKNDIIPEYTQEFIRYLKEKGSLDISEIAYILNTSTKRLRNPKDNPVIRPTPESRVIDWTVFLTNLSEEEKRDLMNFVIGFWEQEDMKRFSFDKNKEYADNQLNQKSYSNIKFFKTLNELPDNEQRKRYLGRFLVTKYKDYKGVGLREQGISKEQNESDKIKKEYNIPVESVAAPESLNPETMYINDEEEPEEESWEDIEKRLDERRKREEMNKKSSWECDSIDEMLTINSTNG